MIPVYHVDAFSDIPFAGNSAGVVLDAATLPADRMQQIAAELRHSETVFVLPGERGGDLRFRFFTPLVEVDLCGHATVAAAWVLASEQRVGRQFRIETEAGILPLEVDGTRIWMTQSPPLVKDVDVAPAVAANLLHLEPANVAVSIGPIARAYTGNWHLIVPVWTRAAINNAIPDLEGIAALNAELECDTTHLWCAEDVKKGGEIYTRDFAPAVGVPEDPVTGTANGALGAYLAHHGILKGDPIRFTARQGDAMGRPGEVQVVASKSSVKIGGAATIVSKGSLFLG